ncbi:DUF2975 domain-containing protein [Pedobacter fastidiosus]|uniref:DUF2975 domain-containing protein n=1 Tax=Pedobacter fastidiosus TaxID=2765361 RepID=A0ABR7KPK6_9SPHI|nr:DUF2975 domain-containing protein [Pedobacter fastidiosus]MBC6110016.1 DUF2975 domain-containing protein [Pedobacter fastidiosus]
MKTQIKFIKLAYLVILTLTFAFGFIYGGRESFEEGYNEASNIEGSKKLSPMLIKANNPLFLNLKDHVSGDSLNLNISYLADVRVFKKSQDTTSLLDALSFLKGCILLIITFFALRVLVYLYRFIDSIQRGDVFSTENIKRLSLMGYYCMSIPFVILGLDLITYTINKSFFKNLPYKVVYQGDFDFWLLIFGLTLLTIAFVFKKGIEIKQENDLTI